MLRYGADLRIPDVRWSRFPGSGSKTWCHCYGNGTGTGTVGTRNRNHYLITDLSVTGTVINQKRSHRLSTVYNLISPCKILLYPVISHLWNTDYNYSGSGWDLAKSSRSDLTRIQNTDFRIFYDGLPSCSQSLIPNGKHQCCGSRTFPKSPIQQHRKKGTKKI